MARISRWRLVWGIVVLVCGWLALPPNAAAATNPIVFNIPAQPLPAALHDFAQQAHLQLLFD